MEVSTLSEIDSMMQPSSLVLLVMIAFLWVGVWFQWRGKKFAAYLRKWGPRNVPGFISPQWVQDRFHLTYAPVALGASILFVPSSLVAFLENEIGVRLGIGYAMIAICSFLIGPSIMIVLGITVVRSNKPAFLVPPHERDQPTGLELREVGKSTPKKRNHLCAEM